MDRCRLFTILPIVALTASCGGLRDGGCGGHSADHSHAQPAGGSGAQRNVSYRCPMHADVVSNAPGDCPKCGMNLVAEQ